MFPTREGVAVAAMTIALAVCGAESPPKHLEVRTAQPGNAMRACSNIDGAAVDLVFKITGQSPSESDVVNHSSKGRELHVRVNASFDEIRKTRAWSIRNPDRSGGALAWMCVPGEYPCDSATRGWMTFSKVSDEAIEGEWNLVFESRHVATGRFGASVVDGPPPGCAE